jgi:ABC-type uncharacterized transport system permease subunit
MQRIAVGLVNAPRGSASPWDLRSPSTLPVVQEIPIRARRSGNQHLQNATAVMGHAMVVLSMANFVSYIARRAQVPQAIMDLLLALSSTPWVALLIVNLFLLVLGCFEAVMPILIVLTRSWFRR